MLLMTFLLNQTLNQSKKFHHIKALWKSVLLGWRNWQTRQT